MAGPQGTELGLWGSSQALLAAQEHLRLQEKGDWGGIIEDSSPCPCPGHSNSGRLAPYPLGGVQLESRLLQTGL